jgi:hypothetical protein
MLSVAIVALILYGADTADLFDAGKLLVSLATVFAGAAIAAGLTFVALRAVQHRRALAGGCVGCRFSCQHAMTDAPRRMWLVTSVDRGLATDRGMATGLCTTTDRGATTDLGMPTIPAPRTPAPVPAPQAIPHIPAPRVPVRARAGQPLVLTGRPATGPQWPERPLRATVSSD